MRQSKFDVRPVGNRHLKSIHEILVEGLPFDTFSPAVTREKLFMNPRPRTDRYVVYGAFLRGALAGVMQSVIRSGTSRAWLGLFAVAGRFRRRGVGAALMDRVLEDWTEARIRNGEVMAIPGNYFTPGIDPRYTIACCFLDHFGFTRFGETVNLVADLDVNFRTDAEEKSLLSRGIAIRRAGAKDGRALDRFFDETFGSDWRIEIERSRKLSPPGLHVALVKTRIVGFAAHSTMNREWGFFGPMGTHPDWRRKGIGRVLMKRALMDLRQAGHRTAVIPWAGPVQYYARWAACRVDRVFWRYRAPRQGRRSGGE